MKHDANTVTITDEEVRKITERNDWANRLVEAKQYCVYGESSQIYTWFLCFMIPSAIKKLRSTDP